MVAFGWIAAVLSLAAAVAAPSSHRAEIRTKPVPVENPRDVTELWAGYDPRALPLDIEVKQDWKEDGVHFQRLYFTGEVWEGEPVRVYAITGVPVGARRVPGVLHVHGGGQTVSLEWVRFWTKRGYAAVTLDWLGEMQGRSDFTRWGRVEANMMKQGVRRITRPSVRYSPWYHWALVSRRALTLLEQLPGVDRSRLGVFGVSMGAQITWMLAGVDRRIAAAAAIYGCGWNTYREVVPRDSYAFPVPPEIALWRGTMEPETYARYIACPMLLLSTTNDFHTNMDRAYDTLARTPTDTRLSLTPRYNHHLEPAQGKTLALWMDWHLQGGPEWAKNPRIALEARTSTLEAVAHPDCPDTVESVEVLYAIGDNIPQARFWRDAQVKRNGDAWRAPLAILSTSESVRAICNVTYREGYTLTSNEAVAVPDTLGAVTATERPTTLIDDFSRGTADWTYGLAYTDPYIDQSYLRPATGPDASSALTLNPALWGDRAVSYVVGTHKIADPQWKAPADGVLSFWYRGPAGATLEVHAWVDHWGARQKEYVAKIPLDGSTGWKRFAARADQCVSTQGDKLPDWSAPNRLDFVGTTPAHTFPEFARVEWIKA